MFTGIIEERGEITAITHHHNISRLSFKAKVVLEDVKRLYCREWGLPDSH